MFNGYLLKIDGTVFPNSYIKEDSWFPKTEPIIINDYYDAAYNRHIDRAPRDNVEIDFITRVLTEAEYGIIRGLIKNEMTVEFYNQLTGSYETGIFTYVNDLTPSLYKINNAGAKVYIKEKEYKLVRKRDS